MRRTVRAVRVVVVGLVLGVLVGCGGDGVPGPGASTSVPLGGSGTSGDVAAVVVWPFGEPDDGRWSEHEAVSVLRRADMAIAVAYYTHDWSSPELAATVRWLEVERLFRGDRNGGLDEAEESPEPVTSLTEGPQPRVVIGVEQIERADGAVGFEVTSCVPEAWQRWLDAGQDPRASQAYVETSLVVPAEESGVLQLRDTWTGREQDGDPDLGAARCDLSKLRYGYIDPTRPAGYTYLRSDVIPPDGYETG